MMKTWWQETEDWIRRNELFLLIVFLFLPEFLFYPSLVLVMIYVLRIWIKERGMKKSVFWFFWLYMLVISFIAGNKKSIAVTLFLVVLLAYVYVLQRNMNVSQYVDMQYFIVWASLFNFFFNFIHLEPPFMQSIYAWLEQWFDLERLPPYGSGSYYRAFSTFGNPNLYAFILMMVLLICFNQIQFHLTSRNTNLLVFYSGAFLINTYALLITGTRAILPAVLIGFMMIMMVQGKWLQVKVLILLGACFMLFILLHPDLLPRFFEISSHFQIRYEIWERSLNHISKYPWWGQGFYSYEFLFGDAPHAHNIFIDALLSFGIVGTSLLIAFIGEKIYKMRNTFYLDYPLALALVIATIAYGIFDIPLLALQPSFLFVAILCLPLPHENDVDYESLGQTEES